MTLAAVFVASLLGSLHCVGMCGGFSALVGASGSGERSAGARMGRVAAYHGARMLAYLVLGAVAGGLGSGLDLFGRTAGLQRFAAVSMGGLLIAMSLRTLWRHARGAPALTVAAPLTPLRGTQRGPRTWIPRAQGWLARTSARDGWAGPVAAGLLASLLPCLWLWSYVALAAGTGSTAGGAAVMLAFAAGTVPGLLLVAAFAGEFTRRWAAHAPLLGAACLLGLGLFSMAGWSAGPVTPALPAALDEIPSEAQCHGQAHAEHGEHEGVPDDSTIAQGRP